MHFCAILVCPKYQKELKVTPVQQDIRLPQTFLVEQSLENW